MECKALAAHVHAQVQPAKTMTRFVACLWESGMFLSKNGDRPIVQIRHCSREQFFLHWIYLSVVVFQKDFAIVKEGFHEREYDE